MTDMIERLRATTAEIDGSWMGDTERPIGASCGLLREAATRIAELEAEIARLREALAPLTRLQPATVAEIAAARAALTAPDTGGADGE